MEIDGQLSNLREVANTLEEIGKAFDRVWPNSLGAEIAEQVMIIKANINYIAKCFGKRTNA